MAKAIGLFRDSQATPNGSPAGPRTDVPA